MSKNSNFLLKKFSIYLQLLIAPFFYQYLKFIYLYILMVIIVFYPSYWSFISLLLLMAFHLFGPLILPSLDLGTIRILSCFKLNPFEYLNLPFDAPPEDVKKQYRKVILSYVWDILLNNYYCNLIWRPIINWHWILLMLSYPCWFILTNANIHKQRRLLEVHMFMFMLHLIWCFLLVG